MNDIKTSPGEMNYTESPTVPLIDQGHLSDNDITNHFRALYNSADSDILAIVANSINTYAEAKVRRANSAKFTPEDVRRLLDIIMLHLEHT